MPPPRRDEVFPADVLERLTRWADVVVPDGDTTQLGQKLSALLPSVDACVTGWDAPPLPVELFTESPRLRIIAHAAGSIKGLIPVEALQQGIVVCHAADIIAQAVAECTILLMLTGLRPLHRCDRALKEGQPWQEAASLVPGHRLAGRTVGLVGCGKVARQVISLLQPFKVSLLVYDPYLTGDQAANLGVTSATLDHLMEHSDIVSNHAPITPATHHLIGAREFALLRDHALFINTARAWTVDEAALVAELRRGRIWAALDVFEEEPLPRQSVWRAWRWLRIWNASSAANPSTIKCSLNPIQYWPDAPFLDMPVTGAAVARG
jgi:phosphoglycerate dehydrogenase-like enzyme